MREICAPNGLTAQKRGLYDNNRVIQERDGSNVPTVAYTRGSDLSGTLEGAGGIGGLLGRSHGYSAGNWSTHNFYHADGNGNITALVDSSQALTASYRYDPFGNLISKSGTLADANVYRFSSKEFHANSGLYYYLYRFYSPNMQRWLNRDPLEEVGFRVLRFSRAPIVKSRFGGLSHFGNLTEAWVNRLVESGGVKRPGQHITNLYLFCTNGPTDEIDPLGLNIGIGGGYGCIPTPDQNQHTPCSRSACEATVARAQNAATVACAVGCAFTGPGWTACFGACWSAESIVLGAMY